MYTALTALGDINTDACPDQSFIDQTRRQSGHWLNQQKYLLTSRAVDYLTMGHTEPVTVDQLGYILEPTDGPFLAYVDDLLTNAIHGNRRMIIDPDDAPAPGGAELRIAATPLDNGRPRTDAIAAQRNLYTTVTGTGRCSVIHNVHHSDAPVRLVGGVMLVDPVTVLNSSTPGASDLTTYVADRLFGRGNHRVTSVRLLTMIHDGRLAIGVTAAVEIATLTVDET